ncbi:hypothetical protein BKA56DRAFT_226425 [Ilyonectria sp. MPI-CAGE-AT-0026]|nr:hypothetical protein BKA56DRAFT_226425 [Ilyonectria sp. MPI-CAGE-AT-0026]
MSYTSPLFQKPSNSGDGESEWEPISTWATGGKDGQAGPVPDSFLPNTDGSGGSGIFYPLQSPVQLAPKKKTATQWSCCVCGHTGMSVNIPACQYCSTSRFHLSIASWRHEAPPPRRFCQSANSSMRGRFCLAVLPQTHLHAAPSLSAMSWPRCLVASLPRCLSTWLPLDRRPCLRLTSYLGHEDRPAAPQVVLLVLFFPFEIRTLLVGGLKSMRGCLTGKMVVDLEHIQCT